MKSFKQVLHVTIAVDRSFPHFFVTHCNTSIAVDRSFPHFFVTRNFIFSAFSCYITSILLIITYMC